MRNKPVIIGRDTWTIPDLIKEQCKQLLILGYSHNWIANKLHIDWNSVRSIEDEIDNFGELRNNKKEKLINYIWRRLDVIIDKLLNFKGDKSTSSALTTQLAILIEKVLLLQGEPTSINQFTIADKLQALEQLRSRGIIPGHFIDSLKIKDSTSEAQAIQKAQEGVLVEQIPAKPGPDDTRAVLVPENEGDKSQENGKE